VSILLYLTVTAGDRASRVEWFFIGLALGWVVEVRQQNVTFALLPATYWLRLWITNRSGSPRDVWICLAAAGAGALVGYLPQIAMNVGLHGSPLIWPSKYVRLDWPPHVWRDLFSWDQGLFSWTPAMLPAVLGLAAALSDSHRRLLASIGCAIFTLNVLLIGSLSYGPVLIGQRYLVNCVPFLILGLGVVFEALGADGSRLRVAVAACVLALVVVWNINLETMAVYGGIDRRGSITAFELARHQIVTAPNYWIRHLQGESISRTCFSVVDGFRVGLQGHMMTLAKSGVALGATIVGTWATATLARTVGRAVPRSRWQPSIRAVCSMAVLIPVVVAAYWLWLGRPFEIFE
jgi:hypothetical protein